jgi:dTDP-4-dehydrorhamnose reductase/beta-phosphoglucomutase-like phosphatase (HAD superfamily)
MTVLVAGASGIVGREMCKLLKDNLVDFIGTYNTRPIQNGIKIDFLNESELENTLKNNAVTIVINSIVERFTDVCEKNWDKTVSANITIPDILSRVCNKLSIYLIHISTDYVFDGKNPPFSPFSNVNPLQNYGISKLISEKRITANTDKFTIIRVPVLYTESYEYLDETAVTTIAKKVMNQIEETTEDNVSIRRPVYIPDLCRFILCIINMKRRHCGIIHFYNPFDKTTKYKMAQKISNYLGLSHAHIKPIDSFGKGSANRPLDTQLIDNSYNIREFITTVIDEGIKLCFQKYFHPKIQSAPQDFLVLLDLDGTLVDTDMCHYNAYKKILNDNNFSINEQQFNKMSNHGSMEELFCECRIPEYLWENFRKQKREYLANSLEPIKFIKGAEEFILLLDSLGVEFAVVTNTNMSIVNSFKNKLPTLKKIKNWITREDYDLPKPNSECYLSALERFGTNKKYILGFENTLNGINALKGVTSRIYCITDSNQYSYTLAKKEDVTLIRDFSGFIVT